MRKIVITKRIDRAWMVRVVPLVGEPRAIVVACWKADDAEILVNAMLHAVDYSPYVGASWSVTEIDRDEFQKIRLESPATCVLYPESEPLRARTPIRSESAIHVAFT